ncbi:MAG: SRPBCC family protein [Dehalococcoidales bacterium]
MPRVDNEVIINAPVQKIYNYISQPSKLQQIWPSLVEITNEKLLPNGGYSYRWKYKMSGIMFSGIGECIDIKPNLLLISKNIGDFDSTVTFTFQSRNVRTRITLTFDYNLPLTLSSKLTENIILKMNTKEAGLILDNLRIRFEESRSSFPPY